jgi:hypothetical protein
MDHPQIARMFDGGTTASGRPSFVMELIKALPIKEYCDRNGLPVRSRLQPPSTIACHRGVLGLGHSIVEAAGSPVVCCPCSGELVTTI